MDIKSNILEMTDRAKGDFQVARSLQILTATLDEQAREVLMYVYHDPEIRSIYDAYRASSQLKTSQHRQIIKFPNGIVYKFLDDLFKPKYGSDWLTNKITLFKVLRREELIMPWITVHKL